MGKLLIVVITIGMLIGFCSVGISFFNSSQNGSSRGVRSFAERSIEEHIMDNFGWNPEIKFKNIMHQGDGLWYVSGLLRVDDGHGHVSVGKFNMNIKYNGKKEVSWGEYEDFELEDVDLKLKNFDSLVQYKGEK